MYESGKCLNDVRVFVSIEPADIRCHLPFCESECIRRQNARMPMNICESNVECNNDDLMRIRNFADKCHFERKRERECGGDVGMDNNTIIIIIIRSGALGKVEFMAMTFNDFANTSTHKDFRRKNGERCHR